MEGLRIRETRRFRGEKETERDHVLDLVENYSHKQLFAELDQPIHLKLSPMTEEATARAVELTRLEAEYVVSRDFETLLRINEIRKGV